MNSNKLVSEGFSKNFENNELSILSNEKVIKKMQSHL